ncbi:unnamed protein product [Protopolystoma xenopodis]|uniref:BRCT domain-containing protein n=1 Tax=Protopolystoma xenopodis TaxID=117903 RepID=A0A448WC29_9PLAT|nr:unnamed protein product [Protopolystoma xenopodis]
MVLRMAILIDDASETFENVPLPPFNFANDHADNRLRTSFTHSTHSLSLPLRIPSRRVMAVTGSSLTPRNVTLLRQFCRKFGAVEHARFQPGETTHIVMNEESGELFHSYT